jgi:hypothetical protein
MVRTLERHFRKGRWCQKNYCELIAYEEFANFNHTDSDEPFKVKKGVKSGVVYDPGLQQVEKRLAEKQFEEELKTIEED